MKNGGAIGMFKGKVDILQMNSSGVGLSAWVGDFPDLGLMVRWRRAKKKEAIYHDD
jgi:hypothetical protein